MQTICAIISGRAAERWGGRRTPPSGVAVYRVLIAVMLCLGTTATLAETRYVSDQLEITLRSGTSTRHEILRMLPSGIALEVLKVDNQSGYTRVRTSQGQMGWVLTRFLMKTPAARNQLLRMEKKLAEVELDNRRQQTNSQEAKGKILKLDKERKKLSEDNRKLTQQLAEIRRTASSAIVLNNENKSLKANLVEMERNLQALSQENETLKDRTARDWFMVGAGVVLLGIIIGLIVPRIRWRRKSSWDTL